MMTEDKHLNISECQKVQQRQRDEVGEVFIYQDRILRGIFKDHEALVIEMFSCGFIDEMVEKGYMPRCWVTDLSNEKYSMIVEHEKISPVIYPQEWTFTMLYDASLMVLKVAKLAKKYKLNMKDSHGLNVLFCKSKPMFIDLGSFYLSEVGSAAWRPYKEFKRAYYYPLFMWSRGLTFTGKLSIFSANLTPHEEFLLYRFPFFRFLGFNTIRKIISLQHALTDIAALSDVKVSQILRPKIGQRPTKIFKKFANKIYSNSRELVLLERKLKKLKKMNEYSQWGNYHSIKSKKESRFDEIIRLLNEHTNNVLSVIDIAGNQGKFARKLLSETNVSQVIVQDMDENAIDIGYNNSKINHNDERLSFVHYNALAPMVKESHPAPKVRFKSDLVTALAVQHHLVLSQGYSLENVLQVLGDYTEKYICMEFMPKGIWVTGQNVNIPDWYTIEWFRENFKNHFEILVEKQIGENYILFIGKKENE